jgi:Flp pilus assembly protein TadG
MRSLKRLVCGEDATELVEFAIASMVFLTLLFGVVEFCLLIYAGNFVAFAAQHGSRYAMVRGSDWKSSCSSSSTNYDCLAADSDVKNYVLSLPHPGLSLTKDNIKPTWLNVTADGTTTCTQYAQGCQVQVVVTYNFGLTIPFIPSTYTSIPLTSTSIETIQN